MNDILTLDDLSHLVMLKHNITKKEDADELLKIFLNVIEEGLLADRYVRIKGFGTFKLIEEDTDKGSSVNRVIFVPDTAVKEAVNKPFAHFESIVLNDDVHFEDIDEYILPDNNVTDCEPAEIQPEEDVDVETTDVTTSVVEPNEPIIPKKEEEPKPISTERKIYNNIPWCLMVLILLIGLALGGIMSWLIFISKINIPAYIQVDKEPEKKELLSVSDATLTDTVARIDTFAAIDSVKTEMIVEKKAIDSVLQSTDAIKKIEERLKPETESKPEYYSEKLTYRIVGTIETHTIQRGNTLVKLAYKYYRNKKMWPYIVMYNKSVIKDPNNVPIGTVINIPKLKTIE